MPVANILPDGDVTANWDVTTGATHWDEVNEKTVLSGGSPDDATFVETPTDSDVDEFTLQDAPVNTDLVNTIDVQIRAKIDDGASLAKIRLELFHSGSTPVTGNPKDVVGGDLGGYGVLGEATKQWGSLSLTRTQANSLQLRQTKLAS